MIPFGRLLGAVAVIAVIFAGASPALAGLIAAYTFNDGTGADTSESATVYNLNTVGSGVAYAQEGGAAYASFPGNETEKSYLQIAGPGGAGAFTVSIWFRTDTANQGGYQGVFSNNKSNTAGYSWQLDIHNGTYRAVSSVTGFSTMNCGTPIVDAWQNLIFQKTSAGAEVFVNGVSAATEDTNPGGLHYFRIGANRNSDKLYEMDVDEVMIWDSAEDAAAIFAKGPVVVPEPSSLALGVFALIGFLRIFRHRRQPYS